MVTFIWMNLKIQKEKRKEEASNEGKRKRNYVFSFITGDRIGGISLCRSRAISEYDWWWWQKENGKRKSRYYAEELNEKKKTMNDSVDNFVFCFPFFGCCKKSANKMREKDEKLNGTSKLYVGVRIRTSQQLWYLYGISLCVCLKSSFIYEFFSTILYSNCSFFTITVYIRAWLCVYLCALILFCNLYLLISIINGFQRVLSILLLNCGGGILINIVYLKFYLIVIYNVSKRLGHVKRMKL